MLRDKKHYNQKWVQSRAYSLIACYCLRHCAGHWEFSSTKSVSEGAHLLLYQEMLKYK